MKPGKLITIEGTEGAGKSTALTFIKDYFNEHHIPLLLTREPGGTLFAEEIRCLLLHRELPEVMHPETELLLMFASRNQHIQQVILPALQANKFVVSDRYIDASYAYQGGGRGVSFEKIAQLDKLIVADLQPDLTILLDIPAEMGILRAEQRPLSKDRIEQEQIDFFKRVRNAYLSRAKTDPERIKIVNASLSLVEVKNQIHDILDNFMKRQST